MATLRRYSIVKTRKYSRLWTPDRAILAAFALAAGGGVFMTLHTSGLFRDRSNERFVGYQIQMPIASQIASALDRAHNPPQKTARRDEDPAVVAERQRQAAIEAQLASERQRNASRLFYRNNPDRMPVATVPQQAAPGFREVQLSSQAPGFREVKPWRPQ